MKRFKKYPEFNKIFEEWYDYFKNKSSKEIEQAIKHCGSNRDQAFKAGYIGFKIRYGDGSPYLKDSILYPIYRAGAAIKKLHSEI